MAALVLLAAFLLAGPSGLGAGEAVVAAVGLDADCVCHEAELPAHAEGGSSVADDQHADGADPCPENCPDCDCCPGAKIGALLRPAAIGGISSLAVEPSALASAPATVPYSSIFRPPRCIA